MRDGKELVPHRERHLGQRRGALRRHIRHDGQVELGVDELVAEEGNVVRDRAQVQSQLPAAWSIEPLAPGGGGVDELLQVADDSVVLLEDLLQNLGDVGWAA